jgi:flagellar hook-length control protein FliK
MHLMISNGPVGAKAAQSDTAKPIVVEIARVPFAKVFARDQVATDEEIPQSVSSQDEPGSELHDHEDDLALIAQAPDPTRSPSNSQKSDASHTLPAAEKRQPIAPDLANPPDTRPIRDDVDHAAEKPAANTSIAISSSPEIKQRPSAPTPPVTSDIKLRQSEPSVQAQAPLPGTSRPVTALQFETFPPESPTQEQVQKSEPRMSSLAPIDRHLAGLRATLLPIDLPVQEEIVTIESQKNALAPVDRHLAGLNTTVLPMSTTNGRQSMVPSGNFVALSQADENQAARVQTKASSADTHVSGLAKTHAPAGQNIVHSIAWSPIAQDKLAFRSGNSARSADLGDEPVWNIRMLGAGPATASPVAQIKPDMPPHIPQQIAEALHRSPDRPIEIALNPVELGRVRLTLSTSEAGISVNIVADRPETLDLMRRNIEDLGRSFADLGYEDISFAFGQGERSDHDTADQSDPQGDAKLRDAPQGQENALTLTHAPRLAIAPDGIDMRL